MGLGKNIKFQGTLYTSVQVCSFAGSGLDAWEWDDCYTLEVEGGASDPGVHCMSGHTSWLPDMSR